ncbi:hypothetical protein [Deinococcus sp. UR1]|uniref:hypothetical protein n=1 Tax=Deinococcus sp. UR1 TaxID=1704277 RepID=UPI000C18C259|nr:hypothetical protein [Deinococcus sp. UR1]PIG96589.1 hypothetical protein AMD26_016230 [Deinococcus sp. UR1]
MTVQLRRDAAHASIAQVTGSQDARFRVGQVVSVQVKTHGGKTALEVDGHPASLLDTDHVHELNVEVSIG